MAVRNVPYAYLPGRDCFLFWGDQGVAKPPCCGYWLDLKSQQQVRLYIDGIDITDVPAYERPVNMMFRSYALFPPYDRRPKYSFWTQARAFTNKGHS